jgi:hypothetical protein
MPVTIGDEGRSGPSLTRPFRDGIGRPFVGKFITQLWKTFYKLAIDLTQAIF